MELVVIFAGVIAVLWAVSPHVLTSWGGLLVLGGAGLSGLLSLVEGVQRGQRLAAALTRVLGVGVLAFGAVYGPLWALTELSPSASWSRISMGASQQLAAPATAVPTRPPATVSPQATAIPTSVPTLPPMPSPVPGVAAAAGTCGQATVSGVAGLALRAAPGARSQVLGARPQGTTVDVLCEAPVKADGIIWQHVRSGDAEGWMSAQFLKPLATQGE